MDRAGHFQIAVVRVERLKRSLVLLALAIMSISALASPLPPASVRAPWTELEKLRFEDWAIKAFKGWDVPLDGGSKVFFFETAGGIRFDVMAANPAYWTEDEKQRREQVFFVLHKNKFYRLEAGSEQEESLITMIESARPKLAGKGKTDPKLLARLVERIRDRRSMFHPKGKRSLTEKPTPAESAKERLPKN